MDIYTESLITISIYKNMAIRKRDNIVNNPSKCFIPFLKKRLREYDEKRIQELNLEIEAFEKEAKSLIEMRDIWREIKSMNPKEGRKN